MARTPARTGGLLPLERSALGSPRFARRAERGRAQDAAGLDRRDRSRRSSPNGGGSSGPARVEPWDYWYTVGAAARRVDRLIPVDRLLEINHRIPLVARGRPGCAQGHVRRPAPSGPTAASPSRSRSRWAPGRATSRRTDRGPRGRRGSLRTTPRVASATCPSCSTRAATRCTWPPSGPARRSSTGRSTTPLPRRHGRRRGLGRRRARMAAPLAR